MTPEIFYRVVDNLDLNLYSLNNIHERLAQLDRASASGAEGCGFDSRISQGAYTKTGSLF